MIREKEGISVGIDAIHRPTVLEINLAAIDHNIRALQAHLPSEVEIMAIVKANGYGHGAVPVAKRALAAGATRLGVAVLDEALELREAGVTVPILVMGYTPIHSMHIAQQERISCTLYSEEQVEDAIHFLTGLSTNPLQIHLKIETGMNRLGFADVESFMRASNKILQADQLHLEGVFTHFACADEDDPSYSQKQMERFNEYLDEIKRHQVPVDLIHVDNSAGAILFPQWGKSTVRYGIGLYGLYPSEYTRQTGDIELAPALTLKSSIVHLKDVPTGTPISYGGTYVTTSPSRIATVPIGYGDGYSRALSNKAEVLVRGMRARVVGRVCMDQMMIDVTHIPDVTLGDEVILIGQQGEDRISAEEMADWIGTINYEVVTRLMQRLHRSYVELPIS